MRLCKHQHYLNVLSPKKPCGDSQVVLVVTNLPANAGDAGDAGLIPRLGRSPGEGNANPLQYSCLENLTDRGAWQAVIHGATKSRTGLSDFTCCCCCFQIFPNDKGFCLRFLLITCFCLFLHYVTVSLGIYHNV